MQPDVEMSSMVRARKTANILCCMVRPSQINDMKITPSWGSVQTEDAIQTHCLNDATMNPSASDDEPYEC